MGRGRPPKPIAVHLASGNPSKLSPDEIEERLEAEIKVPFTDVQPPDYLTAAQKREFTGYAEKLLAIDIFSELDVDILAQYCIAKTLYLEYSKQVKAILSKGNRRRDWLAIETLAANCEDVDDLRDLLERLLRRERGDELTKIMGLQDKAHKQCLACARELGLTVTSRLKLAIPKPVEDDDDEL
jgi:P27 family predicted phage terminase small subunit